MQILKSSHRYLGATVEYGDSTPKNQPYWADNQAWERVARHHYSPFEMTLDIIQGH